MKTFKITLSTVLFILINFQLSAQCNPTNIHEAVRNGNFEAGYLKKGIGSKHAFIPGGEFDFFSDLNFAPEYTPKTQAPFSQCNYSMGNLYVVARAENFTCGGNQVVANQPYWGVDYGTPGLVFKDHTFGKQGKGFVLLADLLDSKNMINKTLPAAWEQKININQNQTYYLSLWLTKFGRSKNNAVMQVRIFPMQNGVVDSSAIQVLAISDTLKNELTWKQTKAIWTPQGTYTEAILRVEYLRITGGVEGLDIAIDDISFMNSPQNYLDVYNMSALKINPCVESKNYSINLENGNGETIDLNDKTITWYFNEVEYPAFANQSSVVLNQEGTYKFCVTNQNNFTFSGNVTTVSALQHDENNIRICAQSPVLLKSNPFNSAEIEKVVWTSSKIGTKEATEILVSEADSIIVEYINKGDFNCAVKDTVIVVSDYIKGLDKDSLVYCSNENIQWISNSPFTKLFLDSLNGKILAQGDTLQFNTNSIPYYTRKLVQAVDYTQVYDTLDLFKGKTSIKPQFFGNPIFNMDFELLEDLILESFDIKTIYTWNTPIIRLTGKVNHDFLLGSSNNNPNRSLSPNVLLPAGKYKLSAPQELFYINQPDTVKYLNNNLIIYPNSIVFLNNLKFKQVQNICGHENIYLKRKEECSFIQNFTDTIFFASKCVTDSFELFLEDNLGKTYELKDKKITWKNDLGNIQTALQNTTKFLLPTNGTYTFLVQDTLTNSKVSGKLIVEESIAKTNINRLFCPGKDSLIVKYHLPLDTNKISGYTWTRLSDNYTTNDKSITVYNADKVKLEIQSANGFNCNLLDTIVVKDFIFDLPDTIFYCNKDSIKIQTNQLNTYYSFDAGGFSYFFHEDTILKTSLNEIFASVYEPFGNFKGSLIEKNKLTQRSTGGFDLKTTQIIVNHPMILQSFKIKTNPKVAQTINVQIGHTLITVQANFVDEVEVKCNIRMLKYSKIETSGDVFFNTLKKSETSSYVIDDMIKFNPDFDQKIFVYDLKFEKKLDLCTGKRIRLVKADDCVVTNKQEIAPQKINIYPNPTNGMLYFDENFELIEVYDINGKIVQSFQNQNQINLAHLSNGVYIIKINNHHYARVIVRN